MNKKNPFNAALDWICTLDENKYKAKSIKRSLVHLSKSYFCKLALYTLRGFSEHKTAIRTAALTFYTVMAMVPVLAIIFAVVKGFGMEEALAVKLYEAIPQFPEFVDYILDFAQNALERTKGGLVAVFSVVVLFWSVIKVFNSAENALNDIWEVKKQRSIARKFSDYLAIVLVVPVLWLTASASSMYVTQWLGLNDTKIYMWLSRLISIILMCVMLTFVYMVLPNTKVRFRSALVAGLIAGTFFMLFQWAYVVIQTKMTAYNAIYGSFAALPLFLIWMLWNWQIVLTGGELSFAVQNMEKFEQERNALKVSHDDRLKITLAVMLLLVRKFMGGSGAIDSESIASELDLPLRIVRGVLFDLEECGMVLSVTKGEDDRTAYYPPARDVHSIRIYDVINALEKHGDSNLPLEAEELTQVQGLLGGMRERLVELPENRLFTEI